MTVAGPDDHPLVEIDLSAIALNWQKACQVFRGAHLGAVLKNDAYGLGIGRIAPCLVEKGCQNFWVANFSEGVLLRETLGSEQSRIFVLHGSGRVSFHTHAIHGLIPVLACLDEIVLASAEASKNGERYRVAIHLDTGLSRLGLDRTQVELLVEQPHRLDGLIVDTWVTQLARFDDPRSPECLEQRERFIRWTGLLPQADRSLAASTALFTDSSWHFDHARIGSALFGVETAPRFPMNYLPAVTLTAPVLRVQSVPAGTAVGYSGLYKTAAPSRLATLAIGYGDGLPVSLANHGQVFIHGIAAPIVGGISMGLMTVDVTRFGINQVKAGTRAEIYGRHQPVHQLAQLAGIAPNALLVPTASLATRVYRTAIAKVSEENEA